MIAMVIIGCGLGVIIGVIAWLLRQGKAAHDRRFLTGAMVRVGRMATGIVIHGASGKE